MSSALENVDEMHIKTAVAHKYGKVATSPQSRFEFPVGRAFAESVGYLPEVLSQLPSSLWESFTGAGNPQSFIDILPGETIIDLGCGAGLDVYLYAKATGAKGKVYGIDISYEMITKAEKNMSLMGMQNTKFCWVSVDKIPLPDSSIDLITANGIYNLSPDKAAVMKEVLRLLKPGGRTIFAEIVLKEELPKENRRNMNDWFRCIGGALKEDDFLKQLNMCGFTDPRILWKGRNARTGHKSALCAVIRAEKE
jgi:SAM-dependent methyltransferase